MGSVGVAVRPRAEAENLEAGQRSIGRVTGPKRENVAVMRLLRLHRGLRGFGRHFLPAASENYIHEPCREPKR